MKTKTYRYFVTVSLGQAGSYSDHVEADSHLSAAMKFIDQFGGTPVHETRYMIGLRPSQCNMKVSGPKPNQTLRYDASGDIDHTYDHYAQSFCQIPGDPVLQICGEIEP